MNDPSTLMMVVRGNTHIQGVDVKPLPCPFCSMEIFLIVLTMEGYCVYCQKCEAHGPGCRIEENAITAWNIRASK